MLKAKLVVHDVTNSVQERLAPMLAARGHRLAEKKIALRMVLRSPTSQITAAAKRRQARPDFIFAKSCAKYCDRRGAICAAQTPSPIVFAPITPFGMSRRLTVYSRIFWPFCRADAASKPRGMLIFFTRGW